MKVINLRCEHEHAFEGWFASGDDYLSQSERGLVRCPVCDSAVVRKLPSAPHLNIGHANQPPPPPVDAMTPQMRLLEQVRRLIAASEDVGDRFVEEARKIHYEEAGQRSIRGIASNEERAALEDEGIDVLTVPWPLVPKDTLQ